MSLAKEAIRSVLLVSWFSRFVVRPLKLLPGSIRMRFLKRIPVVGEVHFDNGSGRDLVMENDGLDSIANNLYWTGIDGYEPELTRLIPRLVSRDKDVLDIGANTGLISLLFASHGARRVFAFEPVPTIFSRLQKNLTRNGFDNIVAEAMAVGRESGQVSIFIPPSRAVAKSASIETPLYPGTEATTVPVTTVDEYCAAQGIENLGLAKIDVEGRELSVLRGMRATLERTRIPVLCEILRDSDREGLDEFLREIGYDAHALRRNGVSRVDRLADWDIQGRDYNFFLAPQGGSLLDHVTRED